MNFSKNRVTTNIPINVKVAEKQDEYLTLHANLSPNGQMAFAFELSDEDIENIIDNRKIYISMLTFGKPMQPIHLNTDEDDFEEVHKANEEFIEFEANENTTVA